MFLAASSVEWMERLQQEWSVYDDAILSIATSSVSTFSPTSTSRIHQKLLVGDPHAPWNLRSKWLTPLSNTTILTNIRS